MLTLIELYEVQGYSDDQTVSVKERLGVSCLKLQYPHFVDERFCGMIDVIHHNYIRFAENDEGDFTEETLPSELVSKADSLRDELIEQLAEVDNSYSDLYLEVRIRRRSH